MDFDGGVPINSSNIEEKETPFQSRTLSEAWPGVAQVLETDMVALWWVLFCEQHKFENRS